MSKQYGATEPDNGFRSVSIIIIVAEKECRPQSFNITKYCVVLLKSIVGGARRQLKSKIKTRYGR